MNVRLMLRRYIKLAAKTAGSLKFHSDIPKEQIFF